METNYSTTTGVGELTYSEGHSHCKGTYGNVGLNHMSNLCVTEDLEVIVRERSDKGDMMVIENGDYILATLRRGQGIITSFGTLLLKQRQLPCQ